MKNGDGENYKPCAKIFSVMVDISCPHCEEVIALDDDASGVFACPFCEGEFEWNLEETDEGFDTEKYAPAPVLIQTGEKDMAMYSPPVSGGVALRWSMGLAITLMGVGVVIGSILAMFFSSQVAAIESGAIDAANNPLKRAPHTMAAVISDHWDRPYSRVQAAFPMEGQEQQKVWPAVARIDNAFGDRNLICTCPSVEEMAKAA